MENLKEVNMTWVEKGLYRKHKPYEIIRSYIWQTWYKIKDIPYLIQDFITRGCKGYSKRDIWNFNSYLSKLLMNGLTDLKKDSHGCPSELTEKEWNKIQDKMIRAFRLLYEIDFNKDNKTIFYYPSKMKKEIRKVQRYFKNDNRVKIYSIREAKEIERGLQLFIEHYESLWD